MAKNEVSGWIALPAYFGIASYAAALIIYPRPTLAITIFLVLFVGFIVASYQKKEPPH